MRAPAPSNPWPAPFVFLAFAQSCNLRNLTLIHRYVDIPVQTQEAYKELPFGHYQAKDTINSCDVMTCRIDPTGSRSKLGYVRTFQSSKSPKHGQEGSMLIPGGHVSLSSLKLGRGPWAQAPFAWV